MTVPLSTRIDEKAKKILDQLHEKTRVPICALTEQGIFLLKQEYDKMREGKQGEIIDMQFMRLLDYRMRKYDAAYKNLAE